MIASERGNHLVVQPVIFYPGKIVESVGDENDVYSTRVPLEQMLFALGQLFDQDC